MSLLSLYSRKDILGLDPETYMRNATYDDMWQNLGVTFNVAALVRESTDSEEQLKALGVQKEEIIKKIEKTDHFRLSANNIFVESASGLQASDRPAFSLMCQKAVEGQFQILVVDSVSRLGRNNRESLDVIDDFIKLGIGILIIKEKYWTFNLSPLDSTRIMMDVGMAQSESMTIGLRVSAHMKTLAESGQIMGGDLFGYRLKHQTDKYGKYDAKNNSLVQEPVEAATVREVFRLYNSDDEDVVKTSSSICRYLIDNGFRTFDGDFNWTPSKVIRILSNTKYMGYQLPGKSKVVDTVRKKKVLTKVMPVRDEYDKDGNVSKRGNLVKINCEAIVSEEDWWKAFYRRMSRSSNGSENVKGRKSGLRISSDAIGRKAYCSCGYCLSRQYTHVATDKTEARFRYKCRGQIDYDSTYTKGGKHDRDICDAPAVAEMKFWLMGKKVFEYMFKNGRTALMQTLEIIEQSRIETEVVDDGKTMSDLTFSLDKLKNRLKNFQLMRADGELSADEYKEYKKETEDQIESIHKSITDYELNKAKAQKRLFDMEAIRERLNTFIDLRGRKVSDEMVDLFVERIIYRGIVDGEDEFLWVMNLSGEATDASVKYRIKKYDAEYAEFLKSDKNFNIVTRMHIPFEECKRFCEEEAKRGFKAPFWRPITIKIAIM